MVSFARVFCRHPPPVPTSYCDPAWAPGLNPRLPGYAVPGRERCPTPPNHLLPEELQMSAMWAAVKLRKRGWGRRFLASLTQCFSMRVSFDAQRRFAGGMAAEARRLWLSFLSYLLALLPPPSPYPCPPFPPLLHAAGEGHTN
eukprot:365966-Chlamydomonas_euryale.AAC.6